MTHAQAGSNDSYPPSSKDLSPLEVLALNKPTDVVRLERDYASGEGVCQFWSGYPSELEDRVCPYNKRRAVLSRRQVNPTQWSSFMNDLNAILASAYNPRLSIVDNTLAVLTLYLSKFIKTSHYDKVGSGSFCTLDVLKRSCRIQEMKRFDERVFEANRIFNLKGLNILDPRKNAFLFVRPDHGADCSISLIILAVAQLEIEYY